MITRNKKFLLMMITSAMVTSPVWAADQPVCVKLIVQKHCPASVPTQKPCSSTKFDAYLMQCNNIVLKSNSMSDENHSLP